MTAPRPALSRPLRAGVAALLGAGSLTAFYLAIVTLAESWSHALQLLRRDAPFVIPMVLGFGAQVGLFAYLRQAPHPGHRFRTGGAVAGTSGGTSTAAMLACCAHHLADVLPLMGLSAASALLASYKPWLVATGLAVNAIGLAIMLRLVRRERRRMVSVVPSRETCHG